uniref:Uncharacterized protein n=1 Tax=Magallana gigas TaxID=29159 RepID=K1PA63_MAGGI
MTPRDHKYCDDLNNQTLLDDSLKYVSVFYLILIDSSSLPVNLNMDVDLGEAKKISSFLPRTQTESNKEDIPDFCFGGKFLPHPSHGGRHFQNGAGFYLTPKRSENAVAGARTRLLILSKPAGMSSTCREFNCV